MNDLTTTTQQKPPSAAQRKFQQMADLSRHQFMQMGSKLLDRSFTTADEVLDAEKLGKREMWMIGGSLLAFGLAVCSVAAAAWLDEQIEGE